MARGKCPFDKKVCKVDCVLYRRGMRYWDDPSRKPEPFEECALNIGVDCLENLIGRSIGQQKATEQARNEMAALKQLFYALVARKQIEQMKQDAVDEQSQIEIKEEEIEVDASS